MKILNPVGAPRTSGERALLTVSGIAGLRLAILTNHWKSMDRMARRMIARASERYAAVGVELYDIPINGPMAEAVEHGVLQDCDAAIVGLAN
ncbi:MAG: hypothetical protein HY322_09280 [Betaproteobacteria bacterium]|nr:hypothetical protein [Betaproteobacteria bacterium]